MSGIASWNDFSGGLGGSTSAGSSSRGFLKSIGGIGGAATIFGGGLEAYGAIVQGSASAKLAGLNKEQLAEELKLTRVQAKAAERARRDAYEDTFATQLAIQAARGIDIGSAGSTRRIAEVTTENFEADLALLHDYMDTRVAQLEAGMSAAKEQQKAAKKNETLDILKTGIGVVSTLSKFGVFP